MSRSSTRVLERRMNALSQANEIRSKRARLKQHLRQGRILLEEVLAAPGDYLVTAEVLDLLLAVPKIGPVKAARLLSKAGVSQAKTVGRLSERQRGRLIDLLRNAHSEALLDRADNPVKP